MKYLIGYILFWAIILALVLGCQSCSMVHRIVDKKNITVDSSASHRTDSAATHVSKDSSNYLDIEDADITIELGPDSVKAVDNFSNKTVQAVHDIVKAASGNRAPTRVTIHVGHISDSSRLTVKTDSSRVVTSDTSHLKKSVETVHKDVKRTNYIVFVIIISLILLIILIILYLRGKLSFITKLF